MKSATGLGRPPRRWSGLRRPTLVAALCVGMPGLAQAFPGGLDYLPTIAWIDPKSAVGFSVVTGLVIFATTLSVLHMLQRRGWTERERELLAQVAVLRSGQERAALFAEADRQALLVWEGHGEPTLEGDVAVAAELAGQRPLHAFGSWLKPRDAQRIDDLLDRLRGRGESFRATLATATGGFVEADGRAQGGRAILRLRDVTGLQDRLLAAETESSDAQARAASYRALLDALDMPGWLRGPDGRLRWVNVAYARAVGALSGEDAAARGLELLDRADRDAARQRRADGAVYRARVAAILDGTRRSLDITEAALPGGSGGVAQDVSELDQARSERQRQSRAHARILDQVPTAVAMFDSSQRLVFHNAAYRALWELDGAFLDSRPSDGEILERLRSAGRLPEQADFRAWKASLLEVYLRPVAEETYWYLPDRRTLRVVVNSSPVTGTTYLFDDVTDRIHLESRYNALIGVQRETLDTLAEGVALFETNGRLKLFNRAFADIWHLDPDLLAGQPHVEAIVEMCRALAPDEAAWTELRGAVQGLTEMRLRVASRLDRLDGTSLDCAAEPMPDGGTLLTFVDVTASVNVERALTERTEALEVGARLRNEFVHHVSYELRSPLTNIIGFAELLGAETAGPLTQRQRDYAEHITRSSGALLAIINDILDLASIDTETLDLVPEKIDIIDTIGEAARGVADRLAEARLRLDIDVPADIGSFTADGKRVRQILFNLLSNAAGFSSAGQTITVAARRVGEDVVLSVVDRGAGIPEAVKARIFDRFETHTFGTRHRGVGLGLSIVRSFVELHGGHVELTSELGRGTTVSCFFPADGRPARQIAAE